MINRGFFVFFDSGSYEALISGLIKWMLKAASQFHQEKVFGYVMNRKSVMPRTALRYAIEKMPPELKARAMAK